MCFQMKYVYIKKRNSNRRFRLDVSDDKIRNPVCDRVGRGEGSPAWFAITSEIRRNSDT